MRTAAAATLSLALLLPSVLSAQMFDVGFGSEAYSEAIFYGSFPYSPASAVHVGTNSAYGFTGSGEVSVFVDPDAATLRFESGFLSAAPVSITYVKSFQQGLSVKDYTIQISFDQMSVGFEGSEPANLVSVGGDYFRIDNASAHDAGYITKLSLGNVDFSLSGSYSVTGTAGSLSGDFAISAAPSGTQVVLDWLSSTKALASISDYPDQLQLLRGDSSNALYPEFALGYIRISQAQLFSIEFDGFLFDPAVTAELFLPANLTLHAVPEPAHWGTIASAFVGVLIVVRRKGKVLWGRVS